MAFKPEVFVEGRWERNGLVFASEKEAADNARNLMWRWLLVEDSRAVEVDEPVNSKWTDKGLVFEEKESMK